jgi:ribosomal protein S18 acetylase RimI-like enzyme
MIDLTFQKLTDSEFDNLYSTIIDALKNDELNSGLTYNKYNLSNYPKERLLNEIKNETSAFIIAKIGKETVGYLKINCKGLESTVKENNVLEIELLYIFPTYRGKGIGEKFFQKAYEFSMQCNAKHLWASVNDKNAEAIQFYNNVGMRKFATRMNNFHDEPYNDLLLKIKTCKLQNPSQD